MPHLTRKEMEQAIKDGGSVLYNSQTLWQVAQLPTDADLATDDQSKAAAAGDLQAQIAKLSADLAKLAPAPTMKADPSDEKDTKKAAADTGKR